VFDNLKYKQGSGTLFRISGDRNKNITISKTDDSKASQKIVYEFGASANDVNWK
ncbi:MAG: hypothetical protein JSU05_10920, partial [Bacteroidetes bacterium]|nr:hypothetical protein [Bacteroidota bacterium]